MTKKVPTSFLWLLVCVVAGVTSAGCESVPDPAPAEAVAAPPASPTFRSKSEDPYADAPAIYGSSPPASQGVYRDSGLIFVVVVIETGRERPRQLEGTAMLRAVALLREEFPTLPPRFNARNRLVEKNFDCEKGVYRYALAFRERDIMRLAAK